MVGHVVRVDKNGKGKGIKVTFILERVTEAQRGSRGIVLLFL